MTQQDIKKKIVRVELTVKENYELCKFLSERAGVPGETYEQIAIEANHVLSTSKISRDHIKYRFESLELQLKPANGSDADRIAMLEVKIARLSDLLYRGLSDGAPGAKAAVLAALLDEFGAGR